MESATNAVKHRGTRGDLKKIRDVLESYTVMLSTTMMLLAPNETVRTDGIIISQRTPALIDAILLLCEQDDSVKRMFLTLCTTGAYAQLFGAIAGIVLPIAANHGFLPGPLSTMAMNGITTPSM